jgi:segregation and condensation protein A
MVGGTPFAIVAVGRIADYKVSFPQRSMSRLAVMPPAIPSFVVLQSSRMSFQVELSEFRGPLDLLLFLVRKHEVEISDIPVAPITEQFLQYLEVLHELNVDDVGEFVEMASALIEIKSRSVLPRAEEEEEPLEDPRQDLVRRLLEYKKFKDAASMLEERGRQWQQHYPRLSNDLAERIRDPAEEPIHEIEMWDLVSAFGRILRERAAAGPSKIVYDDTPIEVYMQRIHAQLLEQGKLAISELFEGHTHRSTLVGLFLATLELVRHHGVQLEQGELFDEIWITPGSATEKELDLSRSDHGITNASGSEAASSTSTGPNSTAATEEKPVKKSKPRRKSAKKADEKTEDESA